ncbi:integrase family protein [Pseudonocardia dioxanivorans CB1190]|uniref:Integrase family protein n=1 Tax=Pseudonocardia dioxanivorans (strain ATCC 55486 / DSM 44775 / JCM 13855 / CB1190) TaxID=675635 RepID=F4CSF4_PSEUX|nr:site-specific integrase [Pseudonocardia dioxanivorans]AEA23128.1 integrase family protein [Pseudonocardia dioxanivorans CB1190]
MGYVRDRWRDPARKGKGKRWQVKYRVDGREKDGGSFDTKAMAQRKLVELEASVQRGQWVDPTDRTLVVDLVRAYAATRMHRPRTRDRVESHIRNHIEPTPLGRRRAAAVRPSEVQAWVTDRAEHLSPLTLRNVVTLVRAAFAAAVEDRTIGATPFVRITLPRAEKERLVPLTVAQVELLVDAIGDRYKAMVVAQAGLGLRIGELLALRVEDVDFLRRTVRIEDQIDRYTRDRVPPKTARSRRTVPLPDVVAVALSRHIAEHPPAPNGLLFHTRDGRPLMHDWYGNKVFVACVTRLRERLAEEAAEAVERDEEPPAAFPAGVTPHDLRHHYASVLLASGQSVVAVAELLGHENASLVLSTYGHLLPGSEDIARRAIDAAWGTARTAEEHAPAAQGLPR